VIHNVLQLIFN